MKRFLLIGGASLALILILALVILPRTSVKVDLPPAALPVVVAAPGAPEVKIATLEQLPAPLPLPYDDKADVTATLDAAFAKAQAEGKRVIVNYGGNWCSWCRGLEGVLGLPEVKPFIDANFVVVHVSTGASSSLINSRPETYKRFGVETIDGTPYLVIADADGAVLHKGSEVTDETHETPQAMVDWIAQWAKKGSA